MKKIVMTSLAAVSVAAMIGGGTFATWSDFAVTSSEVSADQLVLDVNSTGSEGFEKMDFAPGVAVERDFVIASRVGDEVPDASLTLVMRDLLGIEDGCTSNSEAAEESGGTITDKTDTSAPCNDSSSEGQFPENAIIRITSTNVPTSDLGTACNSSINPRGGRETSGMTVADFATTYTDASPLNLLASGETLQAGEGVCVGLVLELPAGAGDDTQGDSATFDLEYMLDQI